VWIEIMSATNATFVPLSTYCGLNCLTDSWAPVTVKNTVPFKSTVVTDAATDPVTQGTNVTETATFMNKSGDGLPNLTVRGELWRDNVDAPESFEADGTLFAATAPTIQTDANGQVSSTYTNTDGLTGTDYLYVCVPGFAGATTTDCGLVYDYEPFDNEYLLTIPTPPSTTAMAQVNWTP
jgi:hypothetical protein